MPEPSSISWTVRRHRASAADGIHTEIGFFGGTFTALPVSVQEAYLTEAKRLKDSGTVSAIRLSTRPDALEDMILDLLSFYSVDTVELGVQSFHDEVLRASHRGHSVKDSYTAHDALKKRGFQTGIQLMSGLPLDTHNRSAESARIAASLAPDCVRIYPAVVIRNTKLHKMYASGQYSPQSLEEAVQTAAAMLRIFDEKSVPVIRTGLHPMEDREHNSIIAGPYHTAFGFLVKSRMRRDHAEEMIRSFPGLNDVQSVTLTVPPEYHEEYIGHRRENIHYLNHLFGISIRIIRGVSFSVS